MSLIAIKEFWGDPKKRQIIIYASVLIGLYFLVPVFFTPSDKPKNTKVKNSGTELFSVNEVTQMEERKTKELFNQLAADAQNRELAAKAQEDRLVGREQKMEIEFAKIRGEMNEQKRQYRQLEQALKNNKSFGSNSNQQSEGTGNVIRTTPNGAVMQTVEKPQTQVITRQPYVKGNVLRTVTQGKVRSVKETGKIEESYVELVSVSENSQSVSNPTKQAQATKTDQNALHDEITTWLSAGSIITGTTINGVDAPTSGGQQQKMPMPVLIRIKHEAIMPNNYSLDIRECFIIGTSIGDLATERAYIRSETLSCITESDKAIEVGLTAYAVGRDGKNGVGGRLVTKAGGLLGNAMAAGFLSGISQAAAPTSINVLSTNPGEESMFQKANMSALAESAALQGASTSFDMIAKYYLEMVDASWPVVEVLGGREVDFIVQRGVSLKLGR
ncbi:TraB/VirB10 family protein [Shewanella sp. UCD-KL12]|uniref:TraB/VirB10 family protein n=1 Tax=Shewanella sp. UCD-KL12 TaxID=1917163 RepID=UPI000970729C|nr:TraB/VirB10 family protein [Shewanella sp. UCD-KL12]